MGGGGGGELWAGMQSHITHWLEFLILQQTTDSTDQLTDWHLDNQEQQGTTHGYEYMKVQWKQLKELRSKTTNWFTVNAGHETDDYLIWLLVRREHLYCISSGLLIASAQQQRHRRVSIRGCYRCREGDPSGSPYSNLLNLECEFIQLHFKFTNIHTWTQFVESPGTWSFGKPYLDFFASLPSPAVVFVIWYGSICSILQNHAALLPSVISYSAYTIWHNFWKIFHSRMGKKGAWDKKYHCGFVAASLA